MSVQSNAEFRQQTRAVLQESAGLFRQGKGGDALDLLQSRIIKPYQNKELTEGQWQAFCRTLQLDPLSESMGLSNREFQTPTMVLAQALRDLVAFYCEDPIRKMLKELNDLSAKEAILQAAQILESSGDREAAWKTLDEALPAALRKDPPTISEIVVKEVYRILLDDFKKPSSSFLQQRMKFMARALDSLSMHIFDEKATNEEKPEILSPLHPSRPVLSILIPHLVFTKLKSEDLYRLMRTSKAIKEVAKSSIDFREKATFEELIEWRKKGLLDHPLTSLREIERVKDEHIDENELEAILSLCPNLEVLDMGRDANYHVRNCISLVGKCCPNLRSFSLVNIVNKLPGAGDRILKALSCCPKLRSVSLHCNEYCIPFSLDAMKQFLNGCRDLEELGCDGFLLEDNVLMSIAEANLPLKRIEISPAINPRATSAPFITLFKGNPLLEEITMKRNHLLDDDGMNAIASYCPLITKLDISNSIYGEKGLREVVTNCKQLRHLEIEGRMGFNIGNALLESPCRFTHVNFKGTIMTPEQMIDFVRKNPDLIYIALPEGMTKEVIKAIRVNCPKVTGLSLSWEDRNLIITRDGQIVKEWDASFYFRG